MDIKRPLICDIGYRPPSNLEISKTNLINWTITTAEIFNSCQNFRILLAFREGNQAKFWMVRLGQAGLGYTFIIHGRYYIAMKADEDLTAKNIKKLSDRLSQLTKPRLSYYLEESGATIYDIKSASKRDRLLYILDEGNGSEETRKFLTTIINEEFDLDDVDFFEDAFEGSRFVVDTHPTTGIKLLVNHSKVVGEQVHSHQSYLEKHAPENTLHEYNEAREKLAEGDYAISLYKCRMALDSMTKTGFGEALDQLHSEGLIEKINPATESEYTNKCREYRFIYMAYSWTSWLGSHTDNKGIQTTKVQAEVGITYTAEVLYYLIKILDGNASKNLDKWASI